MSYKFDNMEKNVGTAGTAEPLSDEGFVVRSAVIQAKAGNSGKIYIGGSGVDNTDHYIEAGETFSLPFDAVRSDEGGHDLAKVYIDADTNGEGVNITYIR